jgi:hypothetical protein
MKINADNNMNPENNNQYVGIWVTADGYIRQELLPIGRYDEARGDRKNAYTGIYTIKGNHIDYMYTISVRCFQGNAAAPFAQSFNNLLTSGL